MGQEMGSPFFSGREEGFSSENSDNGGLEFEEMNTKTNPAVTTTVEFLLDGNIQ